MKNSIVKDLSTLTTISEKTLVKFYKKMILSICDSVKESILDPNYEDGKLIETDIGIGTLYMKRIGGEMKYHFTPNDFMKQSIEDTFTNKTSVLQDFLSDNLSKKFMEVYKDLC